MLKLWFIYNVSCFNWSNFSAPDILRILSIIELGWGKEAIWSLSKKLMGFHLVSRSVKLRVCGSSAAIFSATSTTWDCCSRFQATVCFHLSLSSCAKSPSWRPSDGTAMLRCPCLSHPCCWTRKPTAKRSKKTRWKQKRSYSLSALEASKRPTAEVSLQ